MQILINLVKSHNHSDRCLDFCEEKLKYTERRTSFNTPRITKRLLYRQFLGCLDECRQTENSEQISTISRSNVGKKTGKCHYGICELVDDYPTNDIEKILEENKNLHSYFGSAYAPHVVPKARSELDKEENMCQTVSNTLFPKSAPTLDGKDGIIVNTAAYPQLITFETCR